MERMKGIVVTKPIVYGSMSFYQGKKVDEQNSHKWACYVRGVGDDDISVFIKKVVFQLHPSFSSPQRVFERPPYEVCETGWGEFEILIQLYFHDPREKKLDIYHLLQLYPKTPGGGLSTKKPVISEHYDEILFNEPYPDFYQRLQTNIGVPPDVEKLENAFHQDVVLNFQSYNDASIVKQLNDSFSYIRQETDEIREKIKRQDAEIVALRHELREEEKRIREG
jgi:transcription initiation factor IIF auxiliary subunit